MLAGRVFSRRRSVGGSLFRVVHGDGVREVGS